MYVAEMGRGSNACFEVKSSRVVVMTGVKMWKCAKAKNRIAVRKMAFAKPGTLRGFRAMSACD